MTRSVSFLSNSSWRRLGLVLAVVVALLVGGFVLATMPASPEEPVTPDERSTDLYARLTAVGVTDAVIDISDERVLVRYDLPPGTDARSVELYAIGAAHDTVPSANMVVLQVYSNHEPHQEVRVSTEDILAVSSGEIPLSEFDNRIERRQL